MCKICIFAGTTEGRELVEFLAEQPVELMACTATEYGGILLPTEGRLRVSTHRMDKEEMEALIRESGFDLVVDATHPYAAKVTENIASACAATETEYLRLLREESSVPGEAVFMPDVDAAVRFLNSTQGNILLSTGSKELLRFAEMKNFAERVYARVLPAEQSLRLCCEAGLTPGHIIAMQGPFSVEMNAAMLRSVSAGYLVTKDGGASGGFGEKAAAARETGAVLVVIGRPEQREGMSLSDVIKELCRRFALDRRPQVSVVGIGPGSPSAMTEEVRETLEKAECVIGAGRMVETAARRGQSVFHAIAPEVIAGYIASHSEYRSFAIVMSGDVGFFSGAKKLLPLLKDCRVKVLPGISSLACLCARLGTSYEDVVSVSVHGREHDIVPDIRANARSFVLVGGEDGMSRLCRHLTESGLGDVRVSVGERLSYPDEKITVGTAAELAELRFESLSVALIENSGAKEVVTHGIPDEAFQRGSGKDGIIPMTKSEVRSVCLSKLRLTADAVCWDIGAGTGSVAIEMALQVRRGQVYAVECKADALKLLEENRKRFKAANLTVVPGMAPDVCSKMPAATHAFIGGSSENMRQIIQLLIKKNPDVRIVATAVTLESIAELTACMKEFEFTETGVVSLSVARSRAAGKYSLMTGQNPVYVFTMQAGTVK